MPRHAILQKVILELYAKSVKIDMYETKNIRSEKYDAICNSEKRKYPNYHIQNVKK